MKRTRWMWFLLALALLPPSRALAQEGEGPEPVPPVAEITEALPSEEPSSFVPTWPETPAASERPIQSEGPAESAAPSEPMASSEPAQPSSSPGPVPSGKPEETAPPSEPAEPAVSAEAIEPPQPETFSGDMVRVVVPSYGHIVINPYGLPTRLDDGTESREQIVSSPALVANYGSQPVRMEVQVSSLTLGADTVLVPQPPAPLAEDKQLFLYAEFQPMLDEIGTVFWSEGYIGAPNQLLVLGETPFPQEVLILPAAADMPGLGTFRFFGAASGGPDEPWDNTDALHIILTFTFTPVDASGEQPDGNSPLESSPAPEETLAPEGVPTPEEPAAPEEVPTPEEPVAPEEVPTPEEPAAPEEIPASEESAVPEEIPTAEQFPSSEETSGTQP